MTVDYVVPANADWAQNYAILSPAHPLVLPVFPGSKARRAEGDALRISSLADVRRHFKSPKDRFSKEQAPLYARAANAPGSFGRRIEDLSGPWWVILDVDGSTLTPEKASARLSLFGVAHCIHTTWSHNPRLAGLHRYRVLTEFVAFERRRLEWITRQLFGLLGIPPTPESWNSLVFYAPALPAGPLGDLARSTWRWCSDLDAGPTPWRPDPLPAELVEQELAIRSEDLGVEAALQPGESIDVGVLAEALAHIPNVSRNEEWLPVGMALHAAEGAGVLPPGEGRRLWDEWSAGQGYHAYSDGAQDAAWRSFRVREGGIGVGTLLHFARQNGWAGRPVSGAVGERATAFEDFEEFLEPRARRLAALNAQYAFAPFQRCIVDVIRDGGDDLSMLNYQTFEILVNDPIETGFEGRGRPQEMPSGRLWLHHFPGRRVVNHIDYFLPDEPPPPPQTLNLWRGWQTPPGPGEPSLFLDHVRDIVCCGNRDHFAWVLAWMAHVFQHPSEKPGVAIVLRGAEGIGKGVFATYLRHAIGLRASLAITKPDELVGQFNSIQAGKLLLFLDDITWGGRRAHGEEGILKTLITEPRLVLNKKFVASFEAKSFCRIIMSTNEEWAVRAGPTARRFSVLDPDPRMKDRKDYWDALIAEMRGHGPAALVRYLRGLRLTDLPNPRRALDTAGLRDLKEMTLGPLEEAILDALETERLTEMVAWPQADGEPELPAGAWVDQQLLRDAFGSAGAGKPWAGRMRYATRQVKKGLARVFGPMPEKFSHGVRYVRLPAHARAVELFRKATGVTAQAAPEVVPGLVGG